MAKKADSKSGAERPGDYFKTFVYFKDHASAREFIRKYNFFSVCVHGHDRARAQEEAKIELEFFLTKAEIKTVKKLGLEFEVKENMSVVGRARKKEIGKGDRFKGGTIKPKSKNLSPRKDQRGDQ